MANDDKNAAKGFAGLDDLVSDIDAPAARPSPPSPSQPLPPLGTPPPAKIVWTDPNSRPPPISFQVNENLLNPKKSGPRHGGLMWIVAIAVVWLVVWLANFNKASTPNAVPSAPYVSAPAAPAYQPPAPEPAYQAPQASAEVEDQPPYGTGHSLSKDQIRYCLSEDIRLDGWRAAVDNSSAYSVEAFNIGVADYNERCSNFRYRKGSLESVRAEVEVHRDELLQEGRDIAARSQ